MKTTLNIDEQVMRRLKSEAVRQGRTMSELVEMALRRLLDTPPTSRDLPGLPTFRGGRELIDVADREALFRAFDER
jgi:hypothetical protein